MIALIAGQGALPCALLEGLEHRPYVCALEGALPCVAVERIFRLEHIGTLLKELSEKGVTAVCFAGAISRPQLDPEQIDALTLPLIPKVMTALQKGDDGALRIIVALFEDAGLKVLGAHEIAPHLILDAGLYSGVLSDQTRDIAQLGDHALQSMGDADLGQACVLCSEGVVVREGEAGTDAMLLNAGDGQGCILFKGAKPEQDLRVDMPTIGPQTAQLLSQGGFRGAIVEAGRVIVLDQKRTLAIFKEHGLLLWARERSQTHGVTGV